MAKISIFFLFVVSIFSPFKLAKSGEIYDLVEKTKLRNYSDITFYLRLPKEKNIDDSSSDEQSRYSSVRGVMALCTHQSDPDDVRNNVTDSGRFRRFVEFADKYNLALVTWTNFKGYKIGISGDEMKEEIYDKYDDEFSDRAREWRTGWKRLCRKYNLPEKNIMMYGISGGGQMAHRLALQVPEYFFAVHIHVNSSYDQIKKDGNQILWLVTTGTLEYGYSAGIRFYRSALDAGYHMIFRAEPNLGHSDSVDTRMTSMAFFDYCVKFIPDDSNPDWKPPPVDQFYLMRYPTYIGDYLNGEAFERESALEYVSADLMVALPTKEIAEAWGVLVNFKE